MRGDLAETTAADVCRRLAAASADGVLTIDGPSGPGTVTFVAGSIAAASSPTLSARLGDRLVGAGHLSANDLAGLLETQRDSHGQSRLGAMLVDQGYVTHGVIRWFVLEQMYDALLELLRWPFGAFEFVSSEMVPVTEVPVDIPVDEILVEVSRRRQEWDELSRDIPDLEAVPSFRPGASTATAPLEPDEFAVLSSVDGERSVRALAEDLGYGEFEAARIIYGLILLGIVEVRLPEDEVGAALDDALVYDPGAAEQDSQPERRVDAQRTDDHTPDTIVEAEFDGRTLRSMLAEMTGARPSSAPGPAAAPVDDPAPDDPAPDEPAATGVSTSDASTTQDDPSAVRARSESQDTDVSEFLRELSRLALDQEAPQRTPPRAQDDPDRAVRPGPVKRAEPERKKRGLFGRGG